MESGAAGILTGSHVSYQHGSGFTTCHSAMPTVKLLMPWRYMCAHLFSHVLKQQKYGIILDTSTCGLFLLLNNKFLRFIHDYVFSSSSFILTAGLCIA